LVFDSLQGIDLHVHSTASDGTYAPFEILATAQEMGLKAISITDHDTLSGTKEALQLASSFSVSVLSGVEISAKPPPYMKNIKGSLHILGYGFDVENSPLSETLSEFQQIRKKRMFQILQKLQQIGFSISLEDLSTPNESIGRPHIAQKMVEKGFASSINIAFDLYLGKNKPAYVDKYRLPVKDVISLIRDAGGVPVLAHPGLLHIEDPIEYRTIFKCLANEGLLGIEALYPLHSSDQLQFFLKLAQEHHLLITGGSDFHGDIKPDILLGSGNGSFFVPYSLFENLVRNIHTS